MLFRSIAKSNPVFGGVYKLTSVEEDGKIVNKIKVSENVGKITTPGFKQVYRFFDKDSNKALADVITLHDEVIDESKPYRIFHPIHTWKQKTLTNFYAKKLLVRIFDQGKLVYDCPDIEDIRDFTAKQVELMWDELKRFIKPYKYHVDLSEKLWDVKNSLLNKHENK